MAALCLWLPFGLGPGEARAASRHATLVVDGNTGEVLAEQFASEPRYPASLTKIMTLYLVFEMIEQGKLNYTTRIRISEAAASQPPSKLGLVPGSEITVGDAVRALVTKSANDIAVALAEHIAGSETKFAERMTARARQIGMTATTFRNASGLPDSGQITTARDMIALALRIQDDFPRHYRVFATRVFAFGGHLHRNHNTMLATFAGMDGIKTGYTSASGYNLLASVRRDGKHVVAVVFGGQSAAARNARMHVVLSRGLARASATRTRRPAPVIAGSHGRTAVRAPVPSAVSAPTGKPALVEGVTPVAVGLPAASARTAPIPRAPFAVTRVRTVDVGIVADGNTPAPAAPPVEPKRARAVALPPVPSAPPAAPRGLLAAPVVPAAASIGPLPMTLAASAGPGTAPSTLSDQAARLAKGGAPLPAVALPPPSVPPYNLKGPGATAVSGKAAGGMAIQIGAYASEPEAQRQLRMAREKAVAVLEGHGHYTQPVRVAGKSFVRARFSGFDATSAAATCLELRRHQVDCLVVKAD